MYKVTSAHCTYNGGIMMTKSLVNESKSDLIFDRINIFIMICVFIIVLYPLYFIVIASISDPYAVNSGKVILFPKGITLEGYSRVFEHAPLWNGYKNTIIYTLLGTAINVILTLCGGYVLSRRDLVGRNFLSKFVVFTMIFNGGLIPRFLVVKNLGLYDSIWSLILPGAISVYNLIVCKSFFESTIPTELLDSAYIDGCNNIKFFIRIVLPISPAIIAVLILFYAVGHWNSYFDALIYLKSPEKNPLQIVLRDLLVTFEVMQGDAVGDAGTLEAKQKIADIMRFAIIIVSSAPVIIIYPFLQKYFIKGIMVGSIKG